MFLGRLTQDVMVRRARCRRLAAAHAIAPARTMRDIVFLHTPGSDRLGHLDHEAVRACVEPLDMYELPAIDLSAYRARSSPAASTGRDRHP